MRPGRVAAVTASIALVGAVIGGVIGGALLGLAALLAPGSGGGALVVMLVGAASGAGMGALLAPITAWVFLRRVPLGRAIAHTTIGTTVGATLGLVVGMVGMRRWGGLGGVAVLAGTLIGFLVSAIRLRSKTRTPVAATTSDGRTR